MEEISKILNSIKEENISSSNVFGALLNAISSKLDSMAEDDEMLDLIRVYLAEFTEILKKEHDFSASGFKQIENAVLDFENKLVSNGTDGLTKRELVDFIAHVRASFAQLDNNMETASITYTNIAANNFESIKEIISRLSEDLKQRSDSVQDKTSSGFRIIEKNIQLLGDTLAQQAENYKQNAERSIDEIKTLAAGLNDSANQALSEEKLAEKFENLENITRDFSSSLYEVKEDIQTLTADMKLSDDGLKAELENIYSVVHNLLSSLKTGLNSITTEIAQNSAASIIESFNETSVQITETLNECAKNNQLRQALIEENLDEISEKLDDFQLNFKEIASSNAQKIIDSLAGIDLGAQFADFKDLPALADGLRSVTTELVDYKSYVDNIIESLRGYVDDIASAMRKRSESGKADLTKIERFLDENNAECSKSLSVLEEKLDDYVSVLEKTSAETDVKLADSLNEVRDIKAELAGLLEAVETLNIGLGGKLSEIIESISKINLPQNAAEGLSCIEQKLDGFLEEFNRLRPEQSAEAHDALEEEINAITQEICLVNTDLVQTLNDKYEEVCAQFSPLKEEIKAFFESGLNRLADEMKLDTREDLADELMVRINSLSNVEQVVDAVCDLKNYIESMHKNSFDKISKSIDKLVSAKASQDSKLDTINSKLDIMADTDGTDLCFEELNERFDEAGLRLEKLNRRFDELISNGGDVSSALRVLHGKIDLLSPDDTADLNVQIDGIRRLIVEQKQLFNNIIPDEKLSDIELSLNNVANHEELYGVKETILAALSAVFEQISFIEESEDIKDFVEEKTGEINQNLIKVTDQLKKITSDDGYSYTLQDVESDIAKLKMLLNDIDTQGSIENLSENINKISTSMDDLSSNLTQEQMCVLKESFEKINEDILSISARTNKLLLNSGESDRTLGNTLKQFNNVIANLEAKINTEINERIEQKIDSLKSMMAANTKTDKVFHEVLTYIGEWVDGVSEKINDVYEKTSQVDEVKKVLSEIRVSAPSGMLDELEEMYEKQQNRMDRLEMKLERVLSVIEDDSKVAKKLDKVEKQISRLSLDVEKLASYVNEV
ncbi:MAG: hypothetical protein LBK53_07550 [Heliobacteriaceae bacterium]|nr:hypothetical protein [Heliobacteriaceae bacterium]